MGQADLFPLDPDYPVAVRTDPGVLVQEAQSGRQVARIIRPHRRVFEFTVKARSTNQIEQLRDWWARFADRYFVFAHKVWVNNAGVFLARKLPVRWAAPLEEELFSNDAYNGLVQFIESPGDALETADYPTFAAGHPAFFIEEDDATLAKAVTGTWTAAAQANAHAGNEKTNANTNTTDKFRFTYAGYGFRLWARKNTNLGIMEVLLDDVSLGNVDLYNASAQAAAALLTKTDAVLGLHRVDLKATNTKNAASSANTISADAIEVIP